MSDWGDWELQRLGNELGSVELSDEDEAMFDAQADEQERDDWLASWSLPNPTSTHPGNTQCRNRGE